MPTVQIRVRGTPVYLSPWMGVCRRCIGPAYFGYCPRCDPKGAASLIASTAREERLTREALTAALVGEDCDRRGAALNDYETFLKEVRFQ